MMSEEEIRVTRKRNYRSIREMMRISIGIGVNLTTATPLKERLKIINVMLVALSSLSLWEHWIMLRKFIDQVDKIGETVLTGLQTTMSVVKMIYYLFRQHRFRHILKKVMTHQLLQELEIFQRDFPEKDKLKKDINDIMNETWRNIRMQLLIFILLNSGILSNYFIYTLSVNSYHQIKGTPGYVPILPFTGYPIWADKGMSSFYYPFEMFLGACALYIAGMGAISFEGSFIILSMHGVGLIKVLNLLVERSTSESVPPERRTEFLRLAIRHYQRVFDYVEEFNGLYMHVSLSQFLQSLVNFGFVLFEMNIGLESNYVIFFRMIMYLATAVYQVVLYGMNGQRLTTASETIPGAFYNCKWYNESPEFKQLVHMMILRTNRPHYCNISWFSTMTLATLMSMFKASGSYFLLLRDLTE